MKLNNNERLQQWAMNFFFGDAKSKPVTKKKVRNVRNEDTFVVSKRTKTLRVLNITEIDKVINSGEPLRGISYEEYRVYHSLKNNIHDPKQEYIQALKGDKASLREREWRTNPDYHIPERLYNSPEVTADREAVLEKLRRGEKTTEWENKLLGTYSDMYEGIKIEEAARLEGKRVMLQNKISSALSEAGIELSEDEELQFNVWGNDLTVSGNFDKEQLETLNEIFSKDAIGFQYFYQQHHNDAAKAGGLALVYLQSAEKILKEAGGGSVFDIGKDADGNFTGLPGDLGEFIKKNAIGQFGIGDEVYRDRNDDRNRALYMREAFNSVIETVKNGNYNRLKNMTCKLTYKNGILSC